MNMRDAFDLLPLRQMVSACGDALRAFARQDLLDGLSRPDRYRIVRNGNGGQILAASEPALADAQLVLREAYGSRIAFGRPTVHTWVDHREENLMVPVMFVRIDAPRAHAQALRHMLATRCAAIQNIDLQRDRVVLRAEVELARALGLSREIGELTDGSAHVLSWLMRYARASAGWNA